MGAEGGTEYWEYLAGQLDWVQRLADAGPIPEPWRSKGVRVWEYTPQPESTDLIRE